MSILLFIIATVIALLTTYCSSQGSNNDPAYAPEINPHPKYFMTVKGRIDPSLVDKINIQVIADYETYNQKCQYTVNALEGVSRQYYRLITFKANPNVHGSYNLKVPIDYFIPGKCEWAIENIAFQTNAISDTPLLIDYFDNKSFLPRHFDTYQHSLIICPQGLESCHFTIQNHYSGFLSRFNNYVYQIDISSNPND